MKVADFVSIGFIVIQFCSTVCPANGAQPPFPFYALVQRPLMQEDFYPFTGALADCVFPIGTIVRVLDTEVTTEGVKYSTTSVLHRGQAVVGVTIWRYSPLEIALPRSQAEAEVAFKAQALECRRKNGSTVPPPPQSGEILPVEDVGPY